MSIKPRYLVFLLILFFSSMAFANNSLDKCLALQAPFNELSQLILDQNVTNPPQEQLCHRAANASKHYNDERLIKAIAELEKFIIEVQKSKLKYLTEGQAQGLIAEANEIIQFLNDSQTVGSVTGGVYFFQTNIPVSGATVILTFPLSGNSYSAITDENGLFKIENLEPEGAFVIVANNGAGSTGSQQGSLLPTDLEPSILLLIDQSGQGNINGHVKREDQTPISGALVTAIFPETKRNYTATTNAEGFYELNNLVFDGTVILIAFDSNTGASSSDSQIIIASMPSSVVDFTLQSPPVVNPELLNGGFTDGLSGWVSSGPVQIVDRNLVFDLQDN